MLIKREYYCLIAGLPDLFFNESKLVQDSYAFKKELKYQLSTRDYELIKLLFLSFDNENLLTLYFNRQQPFLNLGNISKNTLELQLSPANEFPELPEYMLQFISWMKNREAKELNTEAENILHTLFYEYVLKTKNEFLRNWFMFDLNIKNIITAFNCVRFGYELQKQLIRVHPETLCYSLLIHKRLKHELFEDELPFSDQIFRIAESDAKLIDKEKALDKIKWDYLDEYTFFHYFTIEKVLSYIFKLLITERWMKLDIETGRALLTRLMDDLKTSYEFSEEFSLLK